MLAMMRKMCHSVNNFISFGFVLYFFLWRHKAFRISRQLELIHSSWVKVLIGSGYSIFIRLITIWYAWKYSHFAKFCWNYPSSLKVIKAEHTICKCFKKKSRVTVSCLEKLFGDLYQWNGKFNCSANILI